MYLYGLVWLCSEMIMYLPDLCFDEWNGLASKHQIDTVSPSVCLMSTQRHTVRVSKTRHTCMPAFTQIPMLTVFCTNTHTHTHTYKQSRVEYHTLPPIIQVQTVESKGNIKRVPINSPLTVWESSELTHTHTHINRAVLNTTHSLL